MCVMQVTLLLLKDVLPTCCPLSRAYMPLEDAPVSCIHAVLISTMMVPVPVDPGNNSKSCI